MRSRFVGATNRALSRLAFREYAFFQIDDDPFHPYRDEKAYRTKFTLKAEGD
jgi:hypothetical protein